MGTNGPPSAPGKHVRLDAISQNRNHNEMQSNQGEYIATRKVFDLRLPPTCSPLQIERAKPTRLINLPCQSRSHPLNHHCLTSTPLHEQDNLKSPRGNSHLQNALNPNVPNRPNNHDKTLGRFTTTFISISASISACSSSTQHQILQISRGKRHHNSTIKEIHLILSMGRRAQAFIHLSPQIHTKDIFNAREDNDRVA